jgi:hypothetical protein
MTTMCVFLVLLFSPLSFALYILIETVVIQITCAIGQHSAFRFVMTSSKTDLVSIDS